jgi:hypothetical protein
LFQVVEQGRGHLRAGQHHLGHRCGGGREPGLGDGLEVTVPEQDVGGALPGHQRQRLGEVGGAQYQAGAGAVRAVNRAHDAGVVDDRDQVGDAGVR